MEVYKVLQGRQHKDELVLKLYELEHFYKVCKSSCNIVDFLIFNFYNGIGQIVQNQEFPYQWVGVATALLPKNLLYMNIYF